MIFQKTKIGNICNVGDGAHASIKRAEFGVPYLTSKNFGSNGIKLDSVDFISEADYQEHFRSKSKALTKPQDGDLIFSIIGSIGGAHCYGKNDRFGLSSSVAILRPDENVHSIFLLYYLKSPYLQKWVDTIKSGSAQGFLSLDMIRSLPCSLPPLPIQKQIAEILSAYDALIENNTARIQLLEEMAEELYKEWFVRMRFPATESSPNWKDATFYNPQGQAVKHGGPGALPEGWEVVMIGEAFEIIGGGTPSTTATEFWEGGEINWFSPTDITGSKGLFLSKSKNQITELGLKKSSARLFKPYSVMMTSRATIGEVGVNTTEACTNQGFITCLPNEQFTYPMIVQWLKLNKPVIDIHASGATFKEISKTVFKKLRIIKPSLSICRKYTDTVLTFYAEIEILLAKNQILQETRDLLLPRLMSGKLDVSQLKAYPQAQESTAMAAENGGGYSAR